MAWQNRWKRPDERREALNETQKMIADLVTLARESERLKGMALAQKKPSLWAQHFKTKKAVEELKDKLIRWFGD